MRAFAAKDGHGIRPKFLAPDEFEAASRHNFGGRSTGEIDIPKGPTEIDGLDDQWVTQDKRITSPEGGAKFSEKFVTQFEPTLADAKEHGRQIRNGITDLVP
ncbi:hypothetical protein [Tuwongella immobilis]|uniref:hypothetical protein n=1 Tax=Tuwongella immobilis TaxID=692036 RepID=UPI0013A6E02D|nr:hypothetical protein [Tuwongella immobilis]